MGKKHKRKDMSGAGNPEGFSSSPFAGLNMNLPAGAPPETAAGPPPETTHTPASKPASITAIFSFERKGRGGKSVTTIRGLAPLCDDDKTTFLKQCKKKLGAGGQFEGETLVLQGDQRKRAAELCASRGYKLRGDLGE